MSYLFHVFAVVSVAAAKPFPGGGNDQPTKQEISQEPRILQVSDLIAAAPSGKTNSIFPTAWPSSQYQTSTAGDFFAGSSNPSQPSIAEDASAVLLGSLIPTELDDQPTTPVAGELISETLFQSDPPCINGFWPACCDASKLCIWSGFDEN